MRRWLYIVPLFLIFGFVSEGQAQNIPPNPSPNEGLVIDYADALTAPQRAEMNQRLIAFDDSTSIQIAVVIIERLAGSTAEAMATGIGRAWGVGQSEFDNGIVVLLSMSDREIFIATGYGIEGAVPDALASRIINREIIPHFRRDNYYEGLKAGVDALIAATQGEYKPPRGEFFRSSAFIALMIVGFVFLFFILIAIAAVKSGGGGGGSGGSSGWSSGSSSSSSSSWGSSSSSSGSSFGGFGGGSFGGGGAGGRW